MNTFDNFWLHRNNNWIRERSNQNGTELVDPHNTPALGSILADEMGLGKTLTTLALILKTSNQARDFGNSPSTFENTSRSGATLVICPKSTLTNWETEIKTHFVEDSIPYLIFYGRGRKHIPKEELKSSMVVLTLYNIIGASGNPLHANQVTVKSLKIEWYRIVLDEAQ
ncbi:hypothetical protein PCANC_27970 [Puccinia coronata f. sp. avenae]|uniref:Helicase ATP-binding domain-containing protein n=1 Tax=Puccinia coronata f. sp. avenae TaxID=200324 RepID=A0A2N5TXJ3_9BASI|nr:hypothetical protein PCANC_27970 [Puccinia coronata f. sp. avenae]